MQEYVRGKKKASVKQIGKSELHGTIVTFEPDPEIFKVIQFNWAKITDHIRQQAYLIKGTRIVVIDARESKKPIDATGVFYFKELEQEFPEMTFYFEDGVPSMVSHYNEPLKVVHKNIFYTEKELDGVFVEIALQYVDDISSREMAFANNTYNAEGGTHLTGFRTALTRTLNDYAKKNNLLKTADDALSGDDVREGLTAVISVKLPEIQFEGQTKAKLGSVEARGAVEKVFSETFSAFLEEHPDEARAVIQKVILALRARKAAKAAKDSVLRKGALEGFTLPGKLADCQTQNMEEAEVFIVEGDSAGGCFSGDTKVALVDGRNITFKELVAEYQKGKLNYCYTIKKDGEIGLAPITSPRVTKRHAKVIKVILDNNEEIICTPDHMFMLRGGTYKEAQRLTPQDSLAPLYRKLSKTGGRITIDGYEMVYDIKKHFYIFTHLLADTYNLEQEVYIQSDGTHRHHKDFNKLNNNPVNIVRINKKAHLTLHHEMLHKTLHRPDVIARCVALKQTKEFREKARKKSLENRELFSRNAKKQWEDESYKQYMMQKFLEFYRSSPEYREKNNALLNHAQKKYWEDTANKEKASKRVKAYFTTYPEKKEELSHLAKQQWNDQELRIWRAETTKKQWTADFRKKRKKAYNETYLNKALKVLNDVYSLGGKISAEKYDVIRKATKDKSLIKYDTICQRFFEGDEIRFKNAIKNYNHKVKKIIPLDGAIDVYDLEVKDTHNFALASGIFVHNSAKTARDRRTQAVLPLRGKILNVERARLDKMLASNEIKALVIAMGTAIGDTFNIEKLRYGKIIIATDADVDGAHIRTLLLTLFYRYFKPLVEAGRIYIAMPPLYKIKKGKEIFYVYSDEEKNAVLKKIGAKATDLEETAQSIGEEGGEESSEEENSQKTKKTPSVAIQRYKGLGEMNPEELRETTMDRASRTLKQVTIDDAREADRVFDVLMGTDVPARKSFIQTHAKEAELDI